MRCFETELASSFFCCPPLNEDKREVEEALSKISDSSYLCKENVAWCGHCAPLCKFGKGKWQFCNPYPLATQTGPLKRYLDVHAADKGSIKYVLSPGAWSDGRGTAYLAAHVVYDEYPAFGISYSDMIALIEYRDGNPVRYAVAELDSSVKDLPTVRALFSERNVVLFVHREDRYNVSEFDVYMIRDFRRLFGSEGTVTTFSLRGDAEHLASFRAYKPAVIELAHDCKHYFVVLSEIARFTYGPRELEWCETQLRAHVISERGVSRIEEPLIELGDEPTTKPTVDEHGTRGLAFIDAKQRRLYALTGTPCDVFELIGLNLDRLSEGKEAVETLAVIDNSVSRARLYPRVDLDWAKLADLGGPGVIRADGSEFTPTGCSDYSVALSFEHGGDIRDITGHFPGMKIMLRGNEVRLFYKYDYWDKRPGRLTLRLV